MTAPHRQTRTYGSARQTRRATALAFAAAGFAVALGVAAGGGEAGHVNVIEIENQIITPVTQRYIEKSIAQSEKEGAACLVIVLDTPGGLMESTRAIVKRMLNSDVPIVVYVAPSGSRAASAGVFITLAAHVAAMAPSTNIGAAHPVSIGGLDEPLRKMTERPEGDESQSEEEKEGEREHASPMTDKIVNDTVAWVKTIAKTRGRNEAWAEKAVVESVSITEEEALKENVVELVAKDLDDLLARIDGRTVQVKGQPVTLATEDVMVVRMPMTGWQKLLAAISHPNIAYLLLMLGTLGLIFEFTHPGIGFPGIAGAISLLLSMFAFQILPVNYVAFALLALGLVLLVAEVHVVSYGLLALAGIVCLTLGSIMLVESPDPAVRVSLKLILPTVVTLAAITLLVVTRAVKSFKYPVATGAQEMVGEVGEAATDLDPKGMIYIHGEQWTATSTLPVKQGGKVRVTSLTGLTLEVEPLEPKP